MKSRLKIKLIFLFSSLLFIVISYVYLIRQDYRDIFEYFNFSLLSKDELSKEGINLIKVNKNAILNSSKEFNIDPVAIAGIILSENVLNNNVSNYFEDYYMKNYILKKLPEEEIAGTAPRNMLMWMKKPLRLLMLKKV